MLNLNHDFLELHDFCVRATNLKDGVRIPESDRWMFDSQSLVTKLLFHTASVWHLSHGTKLRDGKLFVDFSSGLVITVAAFETYLAFYYIFVNPSDPEERDLRHFAWRLYGLTERQKYRPFLRQESKELIDSELNEIDQLVEAIKQNKRFTMLDKDEQKHPLKGNWRRGLKWPELAEIAGFDKTSFERIYSYMKSFAHSEGRSAQQIPLGRNHNLQSELFNSCLLYSTVVLARFVFAYASLYSDVNEMLKQELSTFNTALRWRDSLMFPVQA